MHSDQTLVKDYQSDETPLKSYIALMSIYAAATLARELTLAKTKAPARSPKLAEFLLLTLGAYKLSRVVTLSFVVSPVRAPFTKRGKKLSAGEVQDEPRGEGLQKAIGDLVTCPFCFNIWAASALFTAFSFWPKPTLRLASILTAAAVGDYMHLAFKHTREEVTS
jgi:hypothetical protein